MKPAGATIAVLVLAGLTSAQEHVSFPTPDGWIIHRDFQTDQGERLMREILRFLSEP